MDKILTIGSASYKDAAGAWFTYQSLRLANQDIADQIEYILVDNTEGDGALQSLCDKANIRYIKDSRRSTSVRNRIFEESNTPWTMCIDSHVLFYPETIKCFLSWLEDNDSCQDLIHGPMLHDWLTDVVTHMSPVWRNNMFGIWDNDPRGDDEESDAFEIPMHGMGMFASRTDSWLGFHKLFKGFGGEEGYIHTKYRNAGRKALCLPFLRWLHKFREGAPEYPLDIKERVSNYMIGWLDNKQDTEEIHNHFRSLGRETLQSLEEEAINLLMDYAMDVDATIAERFRCKKTTQPSYSTPNNTTEPWKETVVNWSSPQQVSEVRLEILETEGSCAVLEQLSVDSSEGTAEPTNIGVTSEHEKHPASNLLGDNKKFWRASEKQPQAIVYYYDDPIEIKAVTIRAREGGNESNRISKYRLLYKTSEGYHTATEYPA